MCHLTRYCKHHKFSYFLHYIKPALSQLMICRPEGLCEKKSGGGGAPTYILTLFGDFSENFSTNMDQKRWKIIPKKFLHFFYPIALSGLRGEYLNFLFPYDIRGISVTVHEFSLHNTRGISVTVHEFLFQNISSRINILLPNFKNSHAD